MHQKEIETKKNKELWNLFLKGDDNAYAQLYKAYSNDMFVYGTHFTSDRESIKDCIQEVFIKIYSNRSNLKPVDNVKVYLFVSLKNKLFDLFKKDIKYFEIDTIEPVFCTDYSIEEKLINTENLYAQKKKIAQMLETITPRQREIIYYRYVEELSYEEICVLMKMNYQSVRNLIHRSILKIRDTFPDPIFIFSILILLVKKIDGNFLL